MIPDLTNFGFARIARALEAHCREAGIPAADRLLRGMIPPSSSGWWTTSSAARWTVSSSPPAATAMTSMPAFTTACRWCSSTATSASRACPMVISDACKATAELVRDMTQDCGEEIYYFGGLLDLSPAVTGWRVMSSACTGPVSWPRQTGCATGTISRAPAIS